MLLDQPLGLGQRAETRASLVRGSRGRHGRREPVRPRARRARREPGANVAELDAIERLVRLGTGRRLKVWIGNGALLLATRARRNKNAAEQGTVGRSLTPTAVSVRVSQWPVVLPFFGAYAAPRATRTSARSARADRASTRPGLLLIQQTTLKILASGRVELPLAALTRFLEVLVSPQVGQDTGLLTLLFEAPQGALKRLALYDPYGGQNHPSPRTANLNLERKIRPDPPRGPLGKSSANRKSMAARKFVNPDLGNLPAPNNP